MKPETAQRLASAYARAWQIFKGEPCDVIPDRGFFLVTPGGRFQRRKTAAELIRGLDALLHFTRTNP